MTDQKRQILQMLADGKINTDEAERLLNAVESEKDTVSKTEKSEETAQKKAKYLRVIVENPSGNNHGHEHVNIKIPMVILKAGMKFKTMMPDRIKEKVNARLSEKGIDLDELNFENLDEFIEALTENSIDIDSDDEKVRIFCE